MKKNIFILLLTGLSLFGCGGNSGKYEVEGKPKSDSLLTVKRVVAHEWRERDNDYTGGAYYWVNYRIDIVVLSDGSAFKENIIGRYVAGDGVRPSKIDSDAWIY